MRDTNIRALILHPNVGSHLTAHLLVDGARVPGLCELMRHWTTEDEELRAVRRLDLDGYAHVEGASNPLALSADNAAVSIAKLQVVSGKSFNCMSLPPQLSIKLLQGSRGGCSKDDVVVSFFCILVCDQITVGQRNSGRHCGGSSGYTEGDAEGLELSFVEGAIATVGGGQKTPCGDFWSDEQAENATNYRRATGVALLYRWLRGLQPLKTVARTGVASQKTAFTSGGIWKATPKSSRAIHRLLRPCMQADTRRQELTFHFLHVKVLCQRWGSPTDCSRHG